MTENRATVHLQADPLTGPRVDAVQRQETPFELVVLGDFSGRGSRGEIRSSLADVRSVRVDRDDFETLLARLAPRIQLSLDGDSPPFEIELRELDDFHPDGLFDRAPLFGELRRLRSRARDPGELRAVAAELGIGAALPPESDPPAARAAGGGGGVLDQILEQAQPDAKAVPPLPDLTRSSLNSVVRQVVAPYLVPGPDPRQAELIAAIDAAVGAAMRTLLHHPAFQEVEALWRALYLLVRRVETGPLLHVRMVDIARAELAADLSAGGSAPGLLRHILPRDDVAGAEVTPALLVAAYSFGADAGDLALFGSLAALGRDLGAPWLVSGEPELLGAPDLESLAKPERWENPANGWEELRSHPAARYLGVALPRFLLRLPYGEDDDECERFSFEELSTPPRHEEYLWGSPALACATLLAQNFAASGWEMRPGTTRDLDGLPHHIRPVDGEIEALPSAEVWLTENAAERMLDAGVMPLASLRDRNAARVVRFQSVAAPLTPLAGRWTSA
jgi:type VI secretion system protein ImpC